MIKETQNYSHSKLTCKLVYTLIGLIFLSVSTNVYALGQLMVSPTRIVFEGNERTKQVTLINNGTEEGRFRVSFVRKEMTPEGGFITLDENEPGNFSDEMVRFSPRLVTLAPGQSQTVRLMLRKKKGTTDGEYRSHMMFQSMPDPEATDVNELSTHKEGSFSIKLIPVVGITIPVIVRQGNLDVKVSLSDFEIKQGNTVKAQSVLSLKINREGSKSAYGDLRVYFTPKGGKSMDIGQVNGVAVYTSVNSRTVNVSLQTPPEFNLSNGDLHVTFLQRGKDEVTGLIAESRLLVP